MAKSSKNRKVLLRDGRPPLTNNAFKKTHEGSRIISARQKSSKATRSLINTHHQLRKSRAAALAIGNHNLVKNIDEQIDQLGGLEAYQAASLTGQGKDRGGDSSEKLVEWLRELDLIRPQTSSSSLHDLRVLEIGALSSKNAISRLIGKGIDTVKRIDLHSQEPKHIEEIDFMDLPILSFKEDKFDVISLSLVLNYVPDVIQRGEMLRRTTRFLRSHTGSIQTADDQIALPCLFIVLPLSCLSNSRYLTQDHFVEIMASLGYIMIKNHESQKLSYMLFKWHKGESTAEQSPGFKKLEINPGKSRNNFAVVLAPCTDSVSK